MGEPILVVDDEPFVRDILGSALSLQGHRVETAADGAEALERLVGTAFTLVITDLRMPRVTGTQLLDQVRTHWPHTAVIVATAVDDVRTAVDAMAAGAYDYLTKPFDLSTLPFVVGRALERRRLVLAEEECRRALEERNAELLRLDALQEDLTQMIVHDLRNPLSGISQSLDLVDVLSAGALNEKAGRWLKSAQENCVVMTDMINNLLDIGRMEEGGIVLDRHPTSLPAILGTAAEMMGQSARSKDVEIAVETAPGLPPVPADPSMIRRVAINLVTNAVKYAPRGTAVRVHAEAEGNGQRVTVADCGKGIPPELRERVFDKYGQAEVRQVAGMRAFGLGLTFCKMAVEAHAGRIWVDDAPGGGALLGFWLPAFAN